MILIDIFDISGINERTLCWMESCLDKIGTNMDQMAISVVKQTVTSNVSIVVEILSYIP